MHMRTRAVAAAEIEALYQTMHQIGCMGSSPESGFLRSAWSREESEAIEFIRREAEAIGLSPRVDAVGNMVLEVAGTSGQFVETGSHLDTVVLGGNYDGAAGVIAGLAAIKAVLSSAAPRKAGLRLRIWRGEEGGTFGGACKGSRAAFGELPPSELETIFEGATLAEAIAREGFDPSCIAERRSTILQPEIDSVAAHIELHIEQANFLERAGIDIGVVTSIRGPIRYRVQLEGAFDHSGGTPMGAKFRRDANLALGYIMVAIDRLSQEAIASGADLVQTVGVINSERAINDRDRRVYQNATAKISGFCYFNLDIRSAQSAFRRGYVERVLATIQETASEFGVVASFSPISDTEPLEALDEGVAAASMASAESLGISACRMPSGALHDCLYLGQRRQTTGGLVPIGMLFIPCLDGKSHCPEEFTSYEAIAKGASVLAGALQRLAA